VEEIARKVRERGAVFHTDAVQAVGKIPINMADSAIDMLSLSGHKLHAPKGIGVLYVRKGTKFSPFLMGGHQEAGRRAGTENTASIIGMGRAAQLAMDSMEDENTRVRALRDKLETGLLKRVPKSMINGDPENRLPNTTSIAFEYIEGEAILLLMDQLWDLCLIRFRLYFRLVRAVPRAARHGGTLHRRPRFYPIQPEHIQHRRRGRFRHR
jgi:cysteine desulfurase